MGVGIPVGAGVTAGFCQQQVCPEAKHVVPPGSVLRTDEFQPEGQEPVKHANCSPLCNPEQLKGVGVGMGGMGVGIPVQIELVLQPK